MDFAGIVADIVGVINHHHLAEVGEEVEVRVEVQTSFHCLVVLPFIGKRRFDPMEEDEHGQDH